MPEPGGAAALYGFLFQLLNSVEWAVNIAFANAVVEDGRLRQATMTLEPATGGDVRYRAGIGHIVEQFKTRAAGTWSARTLVDEVLPDLHRSIGTTPLEADVEYAFVTDGRYGRVDLFRDFLTLFRIGAPPEAPLAELPNGPERAYLYQEPQSPRAFFRYIVERVRAPTRVPVDNDLSAQRRVWHLLARLKLRDPIALNDLQNAIDARLSRVADRVRDVAQIRRAMIGVLLEHARLGNAILSVDRLLADLDLPRERFRQLVIYARTLAESLEDNLRDIGYRGELDVRTQAAWPPAQPILALVGESGEGKTWRLARVAQSLAQQGEQVLLLRRVRDLEHLQREIVRAVWVRALAHEEEISFHALDRVFRRVTEDQRSIWLTVCIDEPPNWRVARELLAFHWEDHGMRIALCLPPETERSIAAQAGERVAIVPVHDFSTRELRFALEKRGCSWDSLPSDMRRILRKPLLADIYARLAAGAADWIGHNEYGIFDEFWDRLSTAGDQAAFPDDAPTLLTLVSRIVAHPGGYPWTRAQRSAVMDDDTGDRLIRLGWLRRDGQGGVMMAHDRLLNWAVAKQLVSEWKQRQRTAADLAELVRRLSDPWADQSRVSGVRLGYLTMDVVWMASGPEGVSANELAVFFAAIEEHAQSAADPNAFYCELLPTAGVRILPALRERIHQLDSAAEPYWFTDAVAACIVEVGRFNQRPVQEFATALIAEDSLAAQEVGLRVLAVYTVPSRLDRLWQLLGRFTVAYQSAAASTANDWHDHLTRYKAAFDATAAACKHAPDWLSGVMQNAEIGTPGLDQLSFLLTKLARSTGAKLWRRYKSRLFEIVPADRPRGLALCILHFEDRSEVERLESWITANQDHVGLTAWVALCRLDVERALLRLADVEDHIAIGTSQEWGPAILAAAPNVRHRLRQTLLERDASGVRLALIYHGMADEMDADTCRVLMDRLDHALSVLPPGERFCGPGHILRLLSGINASPLLGVLAERAGSPFEHRLAAFAIDRRRRNESLDQGSDYKEARALLFRIGGDGFTELAHAEMEHPRDFVVRNGLNAAVARPGRDTSDRVRGLAADRDRRGTNFRAVEARLYLAPEEVHQEAVHRLALCDDEEAVDHLYALNALHAPETLALAIDRLTRAANGTRVARYALEIATKAGGPVAALRQRAEQLLRGDWNDREYALSALLEMADPDALRILETELEQRRAGHLDDLDWQLLIRLARRDPPNATARQILEAAAGDPRSPARIHAEYYEALGILPTPEAFDRLADAAFDIDTASSSLPVAAIQALARHEPELAVRAARGLFRLHRGSIVEIASFLSRLGREDALSLLIEAARTHAARPIRQVVGRELRRVDASAIDSRLRQILGSVDAPSRAMAVELMGWLPPERHGEELRRCADVDPDMKVRRAALLALRHHSAQDAVRRMQAEFSDADRNHRFVLLECMIELGDSYTLQRPSDPLCIWPILEHEPRVYEWYASERLADRAKAHEDELRSAKNKLLSERNRLGFSED